MERDDSPEPAPDATGSCAICGGPVGPDGACALCAAAAKAPETGSPSACPKCGAEQEADARFCDQCGGALDDSGLPVDGKCPACGGPVTVLSEDRGVCRRCGEKLETPQARLRRLLGFGLVLAAAAAWLIYAFVLAPPRHPY